jgi:tellurite resistance protein TehA-like permease
MFISATSATTVYPIGIMIIKIITIALKACKTYLLRLIKIFWGMGASIFDRGY